MKTIHHHHRKKRHRDLRPRGGPPGTATEPRRTTRRERLTAVNEALRRKLYRTRAERTELLNVIEQQRTLLEHPMRLIALKVFAPFRSSHRTPGR